MKKSSWVADLGPVTVEYLVADVLFVLYCVALYHIALHCTKLYCIVLSGIVLYCILISGEGLVMSENMRTV